MAAHVVSKKANLGVLLALLVLALATWGLAYVDMGRWNLVVAMAIAVMKAGLVWLFFMHAWFQMRLMKIAFGSGIFWLGILVVLTMGDYLSRQELTYPRGHFREQPLPITTGPAQGAVDLSGRRQP